MQVGLIHDYAQGECPGGADATLKRLCDTAPKQVELHWLHINNYLQWNYLDKFILCSTRSIPNVQLEYLLEGKKYVKIFFDYGFVHPSIARNANLLVYMSPKQRDDMLGKFTGPSVHVMPSLVDPDMFYPADKPGKGHVWVGSYSRQKGIRNLFEWAEENQIHIDCYGYGTPRTYLEQSQYCHVKVPVPYEDMPALYRKYDAFVHLPKGPEAGSRVFIEAVLSGLRITTNEFEGDTSFEKHYSARQWKQRLRRAPERFWQAAIKALQR